MFSAVGKYLDTSAAAEAFSQAKNVIAQSTAIEHIYCRGCQGQITLVTAYGRMVSNNQCRMCGSLFCSNCLTKSKVGIPNHMLILDYRKPVNAEDYNVNDKQLLCKPCNEVAKDHCMKIFSIGMHDKFEECMNQYLESGESQIFLFPIPGANPEDTTYRKALRIAVIAEVVADYTGFSLTYKTIKYAYYSSELINIITKGGLAAVLSPLMESLKDYGITGPSAVLRIYYLGCKHTLEFKANVSLKSQLYLKGQTGVLLPETPLDILQYVSSFLSPAQWLYVATLPAPHHSNEWSSWYLSRIIRRQGWTVLMCINETTALPNGIKCPAFALVSRKRRSTTTGTVLREAILVVRGSKSTMDWAINFDEALVDIEYTYKANCQEINSPGNGNVLTATGKAHKGIHQGAMGILDAFSVRAYLLRLLIKGYKITVVGHSLGAGTAALLAAEMRSTVIRDGVEAKMRADNGGVTPPPGGKLTVSEHNCVLAHNISAVVFATPAIVSESIADAYAIDRLLINVVAGNDIIPRVSRKSFAQLAREINDCTAAANAWTTADKSDLWSYVQNIGKASDIHASYGQKAAAEKAISEEATASLVEPSAPPAPTEDATADPAVEPLPTDPPAAATAATSLSTSTAAATAAATSALSGLWSYAKTVSATSTSSATVAPAPSAPPAPVADNPPAAVAPAKPTKPEKPPKATPSASSTSTPAVAPTTDVPPVVVDAIPVKTERAVTEAIVAKLQIDDPEHFIVTPSPIIHLYRENNGQVKSAVVTHTHKAFTRIDLILEEVMQDHLMVSYRDLLTSVKYLKTKEQRLGTGNLKGSDSNEAVLKEIFNTSHFGEEQKDDYQLDGNGKCEADRQIVIRQSITNADFIEGVDNIQVAMAVQQSVNEVLDKSNAVSAPVVEAPLVDDGGASASLSPYTQHWKECNLCGLNVTWPYMLHSDASRAMVTHNCSSCGEVVCSACSPSGDSVPSDGINKYVTLPDLRIPLPSQGLFAPQRVCLACYFNSSHSVHQ